MESVAREGGLTLAARPINQHPVLGQQSGIGIATDGDSHRLEFGTQVDPQSTPPLAGKIDADSTSRHQDDIRLQHPGLLVFQSFVVCLTGIAQQPAKCMQSILWMMLLDYLDCLAPYFFGSKSLCRIPPDRSSFPERRCASAPV